MTSPDVIDTIVVGGYLGAGKTSLVNHLLRQGTGRRTLVVVNDFGTVAVADELVAATDGETMTLTNGCVCCSLTSPLIDMLVTLRDRPDPPELLVLEASGVADPEPVSHHAMIPGFRLAGIVVVVDAETVRQRADHVLVGRTVRRQLQAAGLVVVNKVDLVSPAAVSSLREWLADTAPQAALVDAVQGEVPVAMVVGPELAAATPAGGHDHRDAAPPADPHLTFTWRPSSPVDRARFVAVLTDGSMGVVRAKGVVRFADRPDRGELVHVVGRRIHISAIDGASPDGDGALVLIGLPPGFEAATVRARLEECQTAR